jgi:nucleoside-diphosphate-sugar epimerase
MPLFVVPGDGRYLVQAIHVDDLARICLQAAHGRSDVIMDAAGPDTMSFEELVRAIRGAVGRRTPILARTSRRDGGARARTRPRRARRRPHGRRDSRPDRRAAGPRHPALGHISFIEWLNEHGSTLGDTYAKRAGPPLRSPSGP